MNNNPFDKLIVDESTTDLLKLADLLEGFVVLVRSSKSIEFLPNFQKLPNDLKILVLLAASKAKSNVFNQTEEMAPKEIIELEVAPEGSIKATLKKLLDSSEIKAKNQKYFLPNYRIPDLDEKLKTYKAK